MTEPYKSAAAVEAAIRDAARNAFADDKSMSTQDRIRQEYFRRFLSRIFSERDDSDWLLKGGTGVLARVASGRRTTDVDLFRANNTLDGALAELIRLASIDLGDFFRFVYTKHESVVGGDQQTYTEGYGVGFDVYIGADKKEPLHVDLVVGVIVTYEVTVTPPANRLDLPRLPSNDYRLYPIVDQVADKVCATMADYNGRPSTREKDLVDLMVDDLPKAWTAAEAAGTEVDAKYWSGFYPFGRGADFPLVNETARKLVEHRRWATALDLMSHFVKNGNLDEELVIEAFTSMLREGDPEMRVLSQYEITNLVTFLRESDRVEDGNLARLEWQLLPALDSHPDTSTLQRTLSESPEFFVEVISLIYRPRTATEERTATEGEKNMAGNAWRLLHEWKRVPGTVDATHEVDLDALVAWATKARELLKEADRLDVGESQIGQVLAYSPADEDGTWPAKAVRDFLEAHGSKKVLSGLSMGAYNKRGVTSRGMTEGGTQEYKLAERYAKWADATKAQWPKTARVLRDLADGYRSEGQQNDEEAQRVQEGFRL